MTTTIQKSKQNKIEINRNLFLKNSTPTFNTGFCTHNASSAKNVTVPNLDLAQPLWMSTEHFSILRFCYDGERRKKHGNSSYRVDDNYKVFDVATTSTVNKQWDFDAMLATDVITYCCLLLQNKWLDSAAEHGSHYIRQLDSKQCNRLFGEHFILVFTFNSSANIFICVSLQRTHKYLQICLFGEFLFIPFCVKNYDNSQ